MNLRDKVSVWQIRMANKLLSGRHILVVEDEVMIQVFIEDILASQGASFASAPSVDRALALIDTQAFDAALLDVCLHGNKSYPVAEALKARGIPFAFSTGDIDLAVGYQDRPLLKKPFRPQALVETFAGLFSA